MSEHMGKIVRSKAGHDKGLLFCVIGAQEGRLLLANGKQRKLMAPKGKNAAHVEFFPAEFDHPAIRKLQQGEPVTDREIRKALAAFKEGITLG